MPRRPLPEHLRRPVGRPAVHDWPYLLNGERHHLRPGLDFHCTTESMRAQLYERARAANVKVSVRKVHDELWVEADRNRPASDTTQKYDWDLLLDGKVHQLRFNHDFTAKPESFRVYARQVAGTRGVKLSIKAMGDSLFLQAIHPKPDLSDLPFEIEGF